MPKRRRIRRFQAHLYYLAKPIRHFLPVVGLAIGIVVFGGLCFQRWYGERPLEFSEALYITYCLLLMEHQGPFPAHWLLRVFYIGLPIVGMVVVLDGIVRFSYYILRRDDSGRDWIGAMVKTMSGHVIVVGLGKLGLRIVEQLLQLGESVLILEKDAQCANLAFARRNDVPVLIGNSREAGIFEEMGLARAKSIILATSNDLANLEIALDARRIKPDIRVVLRMFDQELATKIRDAFNIRLTFSTTALAAPLFAASSCDRTIIDSFYAGDRLLVVSDLEVRADSELLHRTVASLRRDDAAYVIVLRRGAEPTYNPADETGFQPGDRIIVQTELATLKKIHEWNHDTPVF